MVDMQMPQWLARFNRRVTNPIQRLWAGWAPMYCILDHVGRKSGRSYRTPLMVFSTRDGVAIMLTYGPDRDWLKNLTAAGSGRMTRYGKTFEVKDPKIMPRAQAARYVTNRWQPLFARLPFEQAVLLTRV